MSLAIGLLGAGRIGQIHARTVNDIESATLVAVHDPVKEKAAQIAVSTEASISDENDILTDPDVQAVLICSPTSSHAEQIERAARAGKAVFCEKPIDLDIERVRNCLEVVGECKTNLMVGFNRRFDPTFNELKKAIQAGAVGEIELLQITSRDPAPPPIEYIEQSGGLFRDMMIHDFDMALFLTGEEITDVSAFGSVQVDDTIGAAGDIDTATVMLKTVTGKLCQISNSRRATYGYDQRIEVHGSTGMIRADNPKSRHIELADEKGFRSKPLMDFFVQRYADSYRHEIRHFVDSVLGNMSASPNGIDGLKALMLAEAAMKSMQENRTIQLR